MDRFSDGFSRRSQRESAGQYIEALFNDSERKSMEAMHGRLSGPISYEALRHFITNSPWEAAPLWAHLRACVPARLGLLSARLRPIFNSHGEHEHGDSGWKDRDPEDKTVVVAGDDHERHGDQRANKGTHGVERLPEAVRCTPDVRRGNVADQCVARRAADPLAHPVDKASSDPPRWHRHRAP